MTGITLIRYKFFRWNQDYYPIIYNKKWWLYMYNYFLLTSYHKYNAKSMVIMKSQGWILILVKYQVIPCNHQVGCCLENLRSGRAIEKKNQADVNFRLKQLWVWKGPVKKQQTIEMPGSHDNWQFK